jgi:two-component system, LytTR family, sensor kinase
VLSVAGSLLSSSSAPAPAPAKVKADSATSSSSVAPPPPPAAKGKGFDLLFWSGFRYYLAWAIVTPGVLWLGRRVPFSRHRWRGPLVIHLLVPVLGAGPFYVFRLLVNAAFGLGLPPLGLLLSLWWTIVPRETVAVLPIYGMVLGGGVALRLFREYEAKQLVAIELQRSLAAAQLDALKMKMQPHFLFNTLNSIGFLAIEKDTAAIVTMVERLGTLLRASMSASQIQLVPLDAEVALLEQYLAIEEVRFKDRLRVVRRIDAAVGRALVPSLVLQPIVENSIKHGFSRRLDASLLDIAIRREGDRLLVVVRDDGPGLPPGWDLATHRGRGLKNVVERLDALYRGQWSLALRNGDPQGTVAELRIPWSEDVRPEIGGSHCLVSQPHDVSAAGGKP